MFAFFFLLLVGGLAYYALTTGTVKPYPLGEQSMQDSLPKISTSDSTTDIEKDLNSVTVTSDDSGFSDVNNDLKNF